MDGILAPADPLNLGLATAQVTGSNIDIDGGTSGVMSFGGAAAGSSHVFSSVDNTDTGGGINIAGSAGGYTFNDTDVTDPNGPRTTKPRARPTSPSRQNNAASIIAVANKSGGRTRFDGPVTADTGTAAAIDLSNNTGGTVTFGGGLDIDTTTGTGFDASGGGTVNVLNDGAGAGLLNFGDTDISGLGAGTGVDLTQAHGNITFNTLDITGTGAAGSTGIDMAGSTNVGTVMMNDTPTRAASSSSGTGRTSTTLPASSTPAASPATMPWSSPA